MSDRPHVLLVEDEEHIRGPLSEVFEREGYAVTAVGTMKAARACVAAGLPDVVVLDWMLPDGQGLDLVARWRRDGLMMPVIFLSARVELVDKVLGLEMGADDYVTKPFEPRELLSRVKARLRTAKLGREAREPSCLVHDEIEMDLDAREVRFRGERVVTTRMEFSLLKVLLESPGRVFTREELLNSVWGYDSTPTTRTVDTHVLQLRSKLDASLIESVRGVGYRVRPKLTKS
jgi:DNA-binding response OmpR family regulator